jgi:two-component system NtrC family sensor kinase
MHPVRVLVIDDNTAIHEDFRRMLDPPVVGGDLAAIDAELGRPPVPIQRRFQVETCASGELGLAAVLAARAVGLRHGVAFVDLRMPGGLDGLATAELLLAGDPLLQVVLCTAYSDHSWATIRARLGTNPADDDRVLVLLSLIHI